ALGDLRLVAQRLVVAQPAVEELRRLDTDHDGELAPVDHPPRLERVLDEPEPALAGAALLRVDVALELVEVRDLPANRLHLVAVVAGALERIDLAEPLVVGVERNEDPQAAHPGAL